MRIRISYLLLAFWLVLGGKATATGFTLTINVVGSGSVTRNPTNSVYPSGATVTLTAIPNDPNWYFSSWSGDASGTENPLNVTMDSNKTITATFQPFATFALTLTTNGQGAISLNPPGGVYTSNTIVTATATPATNWVFASWSGSATGTTNQLSLVMNANYALTGTFAQLPAFDLQPQDATNRVGATVSFTSHAVGDLPLEYHWFFSGGSLTDATNTTLTLTNIQSADAGNYWVIATNNYGSATSSVVALVITNSIGTTNIVYSADESSLRAAIKTGGWIRLAFNGTITLTHTINITNDIILDAQDVSATISGGNAVRLFHVAPGARLSMTNLTLADGSCIVTNGTPGTPADGGAIYNDGGAVVLVSCALTNNNAQSLIYGGLARGGAIFNDGGTVSLYQSVLASNLVVGGGPNNFTASVTIGTALGGAIYNTNGTIKIMASTVSNNLSESVCPEFPDGGLSMGGAMYQASGFSTISITIFASNSALGGAGAGYLGGHTSPAYGGAIAAAGGSLGLVSSQFLDNQAIGGDAGFHAFAGAAFGGAIYSAAALTANDSSFFGNGSLAGNNSLVSYAPRGADGFGGAIYNLGTTLLNRCSVCSNSVQGGSAVGYAGGPANGGDGLGGGIFNASQFAATNCTVALNSSIGGSGSGGGGYIGTNGNAMGGGVFNNTNAMFIGMNLTIASNNCNSTFNSFGYLFTNGFAAGVQGGQHQRHVALAQFHHRLRRHQRKRLRADHR